MTTLYHQGKLLSISRWILPGVVEPATPPCVLTLVALCPHHALYTMSRVCHFGCDGKATKDGLLCCCGVCVCRRASRLRNTLLHTSTKLSTKWWSITRTETNEIERPRVDHTYDRMPGIKVGGVRDIFRGKGPSLARRPVAMAGPSASPRTSFKAVSGPKPAEIAPVCSYR